LSMFCAGIRYPLRPRTEWAVLPYFLTEKSTESRASP